MRSATTSGSTGSAISTSPMPSSPAQSSTPSRTMNSSSTNKSKLISSRDAVDDVGRPGARAVIESSPIPAASPPATEDEKRERRGRKHKEDDTETSSIASKSSWKWFKGSGEGKDKKKHHHHHHHNQGGDDDKKTKGRGHHGERAQDAARLDVIENAIGKGREGISDREGGETQRAHDERRKEGHKKNGESNKKEKDGLLAYLFGGGMKKSEKESGKKRISLPTASPEPSYRDLVADRDYHWTRFPLIKERAIYRLAHMKLANPRRPLHGQVLLSNFMYAYLAKVQAMHPQIQVPKSPQQRRLEEERRRKEQEEQYMREQLLQQEASDDDSTSEQDLEYREAAVRAGLYLSPHDDGEPEDGSQSEGNERQAGREHAYAEQGGLQSYHSADGDDDMAQRHPHAKK